MSILLGLIVLMFFSPLYAQSQPDPKGSFLRSLVIPGWGHYYNDSQNWNRGKVHFGAEILMIGAYFGLNARASNLEDQYHTFARLNSGVSIDSRGRAFQLAISQYDNLTDYNDFQLRSRNWDQLLPDTQENRWEWNTQEDRERYADLRESSDKARNQLPAIAGLMVVNRVVSAISAYRRARDMQSGPELSFKPAYSETSRTGIVANLSFRF